MAKKKDKPQVINNIQELNLEIDYDKLAEAIATAIEKSKSNDNIADNGDEISDDTYIGILKSIWCIIRNKKETQGDILAKSMSIVLRLIFNGLAIALFVIGWVVLFVLSKENVAKFLNGQWWALFNILANSSLAALAWSLALLMRGIANDISWQKNRNYIVSLFSAIVSFAALIVALVALFKGVR